MAEALRGNVEGSEGLESTTVGIYRTSTVVKGGRRFSFGALVVVGDRRGTVGMGYAKAPGVPAAIEKAQKDARKNMKRIQLQGGTLPHPVSMTFGASRVKLLPAAPGTGVIAGGTVRAVLEMVGVRDCLTKASGSTNQKNLCKAALRGLESLRTKEHVQRLRGVEIDATKVEEILAAGEKFMPKQVEGNRVKGPVNRVGDQKQRGGRGGRGRRGGEEAPSQSQPQSQSPAPAPEAQAAPAPEAPPAQ